MSKIFTVQRHFLLSLTTFGALALLTACSPGKEGGEVTASPAEAEEDAFVSSLALPNQDFVTQSYNESNAARKALLSKLAFSEKIKVSELLEVIADDHVKRSTSLDPARSREVWDGKMLLLKIQDLVNAAKTQDPNLLKVAYETELEKSFGGREVLYNSNATSVLNIFRDERVQCYSGTLFNILAYKKSLNGKKDLSRTPVVIFEAGHILPGFILQEAGDNRLYGIETTAQGRALVDYGFTKELHVKLKRPVRVVLMNDFLLSEAIKGYLHLNDVERKVLTAEALKKLTPFGLNVVELEKQVFDSLNASRIQPANVSLAKAETVMSVLELQSGFDGRSSATSVVPLNLTPFGFGVSRENGTDKRRERIDVTTPIASDVMPVDHHREKARREAQAQGGNGLSAVQAIHSPTAENTLLEGSVLAERFGPEHLFARMEYKAVSFELKIFKTQNRYYFVHTSTTTSNAGRKIEENEIRFAERNPSLDKEMDVVKRRMETETPGNIYFDGDIAVIGFWVERDVEDRVYVENLNSPHYKATKPVKLSGRRIDYNARR